MPTTFCAKHKDVVLSVETNHHGELFVEPCEQCLDERYDEGCEDRPEIQIYCYQHDTHELEQYERKDGNIEVEMCHKCAEEEREIGFDNGWEEGKTEGYDAGYDDGYHTAETDHAND